MRASTRLRSIAVLALSLLASLWLLSGDSLAQESLESRIFPNTGHIVKDEFLLFFQDHGGLQVFGYPITDAYYSESAGRVIQYFQNGRLELDSIDNQVRLSPLPEDLLLAKSTPPIEPGDLLLGARFFEPTGHSVMRAFLAFYLKHGGPSVFGYPIAELMEEDSRLVQYFERAMFVWRPELPNGQRVQLERLGIAHFQLAREDPALLNPLLSIVQSEATTDIFVSAAAHSPILRQGEKKQVVSVFVSNQLGRPIAGAQIQLAMPTAEERRSGRSVFTAQTDTEGTAVFEFEIGMLQAGTTVPVQVKARYQQYWSESATAFRIWW